MASSGSGSGSGRIDQNSIKSIRSLQSTVDRLQNNRLQNHARLLLRFHHRLLLRHAVLRLFRLGRSLFQRLLLLRRLRLGPRHLTGLGFRLLCLRLRLRLQLLAFLFLALLRDRLARTCLAPLRLQLAGGVAPLVAALQAVAAARGKTVTQVALNWIMAQGVIPIAGATTDKYVADAAGALGWRLTADECAALEAAADDLGFEFQGTFFKRTDSKFVGYGVEYWTLD